MYKKIALLALTGTLLSTPLLFADWTSNDTRFDAVGNLPQRNDSDITHQIKSDIQADNETATYAPVIEVKTDNGVVTLRGIVDSYKAKADIATKAANANGVIDVVNLITINPPTSK